MTLVQHRFAAEHYGARAQDYVSSAVHSAGPDLDQIEEIVRGQGHARVLDLGCGGGHVSYRAAPHVAEVVACDLTPAMLDLVAATATERGLANIEVRQAPAEALPFANGAFDFVLCRFTAHHWQNMEAGLRQARRVLKTGGRAVIIDTIAPADAVLDTHLQAMEVLRDASHVRNYSLVEWTGALSRSGFALQTVNLRKLRMEFDVWIARTRTPALHAQAIRALQACAPSVVRDAFDIGENGDFNLDVATFVLGAS